MILEEAETPDLDNRLELGSTPEHPAADSLLFHYIRQHFRLKSGNRERPLAWVGRELEQDICLIYLRVSDLSGLNELQVSHSLFFNRFEDQSNIAILQVNGQRQSAYLTRAKPRATLQLKE